MKTLEALASEMRSAQSRLMTAEFLLTRAEETHERMGAALADAKEKAKEAKRKLLQHIEDSLPPVSIDTVGRFEDNWKFTGNEF